VDLAGLIRCVRDVRSFREWGGRVATTEIGLAVVKEGASQRVPIWYPCAAQIAGQQPMGWFRSNRGGVAWLAFFALACQLLLSFGHVHVGKFSGGSTAWAAAEGSGPAAGVPPSSPQNSPIGIPGDFCAICVNISLANALVVPILAIILAPSSFIEVLRWSLAASEPASFDHVLFSARGPPQA